MEMHIGPKYIYMTVVIVMIAMIALLGWFGYAEGRRVAESKTVVSNISEMTKAFETFHKDEDRYPSRQEFSSNKLMLEYFSVFPIHQFTSKECPQSFAYEPFPSYTDYTNSFCLPTRVPGYKSGANTYTTKSQPH